MKVKEESGKAVLKLNIHSKPKEHGIWSHHFMANRWGNNGNSDKLIFLGSKVTVDGDCIREIKRCLLLGRKLMTNLDSILKSRGAKDRKSKRFPEKNIYFHFINYSKAFDCVDHNKMWKILKEMGTPDHLNCLLRNLYAGQETTVRTQLGTTEWFQIGKGENQGCILLLCLFNLYAECIMRNARLDEAHAGIRSLGEISVTSDMQITSPLWQKVKRN